MIKARYVVLNPVRAGMVPAAEGWAWSSYRAMVGRASVPAWLETDWLLRQFGEERGVAQARYADFVRQGVGGASIWEGLRHQLDGEPRRTTPQGRTRLQRAGNLKHARCLNARPGPIAASCIAA